MDMNENKPAAATAAAADQGKGGQGNGQNHKHGRENTHQSIPKGFPKRFSRHTRNERSGNASRQKGNGNDNHRIILQRTDKARA